MLNKTRANEDTTRKVCSIKEKGDEDINNIFHNQ